MPPLVPRGEHAEASGLASGTGLRSPYGEQAILLHGVTMATRISNLDDFFEDFVGELFGKLGCKPDEHPPVGNGFADFLVTTPSSDRFYVEATVVQPNQFSKARPTEDDVCQKLNKICANPCQHWFTATATGELYQNLPTRVLLPIKEWVETLSTNDQSSSIQTFTFRGGRPLLDADEPFDEWTIEIHAQHRSEAHRGVPSPLLASIGRSGGVDSASSLVRAARAKVKQHRHISEPLVLAMNDVADFPSDRIDVSIALFGWEQAADTGVSRITPSSEFGRFRSIWGGHENSTISAILLFQRLLPATLPYAKVCLYENPWARYPIPVWLKQSLPHATVTTESGIQHLRWPSDERLSTVLGIPPESPPYEELERRLNESVKGLFR